MMKRSVRQLFAAPAADRTMTDAFEPDAIETDDIFEETHEAAAPAKVAIVGGGAAAREHLRAFADVAGASVVGVTDPFTNGAQSLADEFDIPVAAADIAELYERTQADIVRASANGPMTAYAMDEILRHPWTVLMDQPIGLNAREAEDVLSKATRLNRQVLVGLHHRALSSTVAALNDLADDPSPRFIHVQDRQSVEIARASGHPPEVVANWMYAGAIHLVDYLLTFGRGSVESVATIQPWNPDRPGVVLAHVRFTSGDAAIYQCLWNGPGPQACSVSTARRRWDLNPLERASYQNAGGPDMVAIASDAWDADFRPGFRRQAERVVAAWSGETTMQPTLAQGVEAMRLVRRIYGV